MLKHCTLVAVMASAGVPAFAQLDGDRTMLDNSLVISGSPMGNPNQHNHKLERDAQRAASARS